MLSLLRNKKYITTVLLIFSLVIASTALAVHTVHVLDLPNISDWKQERFSGETSYNVVTIDGKPYIKAVSKASASGLVREMDIDLTEAPYMNWSWKIENILSDVDETKKSGDDYPARVYVVISGGFFFWKTRAISYTWTSEQEKGAIWPNAFTDNATMVAMQSGDELMGQWVTEKRNVLEDIKNLLGIDATEIHAVAIMTDTDNSKQSATAYYGNILFTEE